MFRQWILGHGFKAKEAQKTYPSEGVRGGSTGEAFGYMRANCESPSNPGIPLPSLSLSPHPWDDYLTGPENELAFAGVQALVRGDREGISPLVVHGPSGVGKSPLLAGLAVEWLGRHSDAAIAHIEAATFAGDWLPRRARRTAMAGPSSGADTAS